ncbi:hypothetical protein P4O66_002111 [Electrophorus voltai]|uniref:Uncharacterized protein n=1 Tax=Electrophorus voltai TaxID=2609070 RepID=A0AAD8Z2A6_9TELE|nr:hypothetical protein P4O66_002111 [Electrophorus voltai]
MPVEYCPDVVAYVDVWSASKTENYSDPFIQQLRDMGAQHRCMQPRDIPLSTPKRLKRKLDKMMEGLVRSSPIGTKQCFVLFFSVAFFFVLSRPSHVISMCTVSDTSPFIIDEENGIVYSPSSRRADTMAQRLKEMRAQRENLSPTASQIQDSGMEDSVGPSLVETPTSLSKLLLEEEEPSCSLSDSHPCSKSEGDKGYYEHPSDKMKSHGQIEKGPCVSAEGLTTVKGGKEPMEVLASPQGKDSKNASDGLIDRCSEMCSKHGTMKTDKYMKNTGNGFQKSRMNYLITFLLHRYKFTCDRALES